MLRTQNNMKIYYLFVFNILIYIILGIILIFKIIERIKEKPKDDDDLNKFNKY